MGSLEVLFLLQSERAPVVPVTAEAMDQGAAGGAANTVSEQSTLVLTLIDALPFLPLPILEEWMWVAAESVWEVTGPAMQEVAKKRFWEVLVSGEMDVERAAIGVEWWGTRGGGELVLRGRSEAPGPPMMSGAISGVSGSSKL